MKITPNEITNPPLTPKQPISPTSASPREQPPDGVGGDTSTYTPSAEWLRLLDQLNQQPQVRADRVTLAAERLRQGFYTSPESTQKAADAMLDALD